MKSQYHWGLLGPQEQLQSLGWLVLSTRTSFRGLHGILSCSYECTVRGYSKTRLDSLSLRYVHVNRSLQSQAKSSLHATFFLTLC